MSESTSTTRRKTFLHNADNLLLIAKGAKADTAEEALVPLMRENQIHKGDTAAKFFHAFDWAAADVLDREKALRDWLRYEFQHKEEQDRDD